MEEVIQPGVRLRRLAGKIYEWDRKLLLLVASFLWVRLAFEGAPILLLVPLLSLGYYLGNSYFLLIIIGALLGSATLTPWAIMMSALFSVSFFVMSQLLRLLRLSLVKRLFVTAMVSDIMVRFGVLLSLQMSITLSSVGLTVVALLATAMVIKIAPLFKAKDKPLLEPLQTFLLFLGLGILTFSFQDLVILRISLTMILIRLLLLMMARLGGLGLSSVFSMVMAVLVVVMTPVRSFEWLVIILSTSLASVGSRYQKWGTMVTFSALTVLMVTLLSIDGWVSGVYRETLLALAIFSLIPDSLFRDWSLQIPSFETLRTVYNQQLRQQQQKMQEQMAAFAAMFEALSKQLSYTDEDSPLDRHMSQVYRHVCINCPKSRICYQQGDNQLVPLIRKALNEGLVSEEEAYVDQHCLKPSVLFGEIHERKQNYLNEYRYSKEYQTLKYLLVNHLNGVAGVATQLTQGFTYEKGLFQKANDNRIKQALERAQLDVVYVRTVPHYNDQTIELGVGGCKEHDLMTKVVPLIQQIMQKSYAIRDVYSLGSEDYFALILEETTIFKITYGVSQVAKDFHGSGDTYAVFNQGPYLYVAISDGMGSGEEAQKQSQLTLELLRRMIVAGMDRHQAIESVNSLLKVRNHVDMYATLDLFVIDTITGKATFSKNGAPPTWLIRDHQLRIEQAESVPIGIMDQVHYQEGEMDLKRGDWLVLMSDGGVLGEDVALDFKSWLGQHPQQIARDLLNLATNKSNSDDITYIVLKID